MRRSAWLAAAFAGFSLGVVSCASGSISGTGGAAGTAGGGAGAGASTGGTVGTGGGGGAETGSGGGGAAGSTGGGTCGTCPTGYSCGSANGIAVCRAKSGVPLFAHVFLILMENTSLSTLQTAMNGTGAPNLAALAAAYATGADYHGVAHPSLPNYIALTSGDTQGIACDCKATPQALGCSTVTCNLLLGTCECDKQVVNLADQLETAHESWMAYGEDMGSPCNLTDSGNYAVRHVPFLYYDDIQKNATRCRSHVVDLSKFSPAVAPVFTYIAPNLIDDMHNPDPPGPQNIPDGDSWLGPKVKAIMDASAYKQGGLLVIVWDEDDGSGGLSGSDNPIPIFVMSPYAKHGGYVSHVKADHYSLLATIEDGLGVPRLLKAGTARSGIAETLSDYFPAQ